MKISLFFEGNKLEVDLWDPIDISIPLRATTNNVTAWYVSPPRIEPVVMGDWIGDVNKGAGVNFRDVYINPHGHGTHTECVGHISKENYSLNQCLKTFMFFAELITVEPVSEGDDKIITKEQLINSCKYKTDALIIRTLPNDDSKLTRQYSATNPPYVYNEATKWMVERGIKHLLIDTPSIDREKDEGKLLAHHEFWKYPHQTREDCTITEMIYIPQNIPDGLYLLNIQITALENDASPSKPVIYKLIR